MNHQIRHLSFIASPKNRKLHLVWSYGLAMLASILLAIGAGTATAAVTPGYVVGWGSDAYGMKTAPSGLSGVIAVASKGDYSLALKNDGTVVAWGGNYSGQLNVPSGLSGVTAISGGYFHGLALKNDGTVVGWGGQGTSFDYGQANVPAGLNGVIAIAAGGYHSLALKNDGTVVAWGANARGQSAVPAGLNGVTAIFAGGVNSLALKSDGTVVGWGDNSYGQSTTPPGLSSVISLAAGDSHTVALMNDGTVVAWGSNRNDTTVVPSGLSGVIEISAGSSHTVALKNDGTVVAWGSNDNGQSTVPEGLNGVRAINASWDHNLAIVPDATPPAITPEISGTLGGNGWYISNVTVSWNVSDSESTVTNKTGCDSSTVFNDTAGTIFTCSAVSAGGSSTHSVTIKRDVSYPDVACGASDSLWHAADVNIACNAGDITSGLANAPDAAFNLTTSVPAGTESGGASSSSRRIADSAGNYVVAGPLGGFKIDKKGPAISLASPIAASYMLKEAVAAAFTCADGGSGLASCTGAVVPDANIDTASVGGRTFTVTATDNVGNSSTASVSYTVGYNFSGFLAAVNAPPSVNTGKSGRTYPVKWQLRDAGNKFIGSLSAVTSVTYQSTSCAAFINVPSSTVELESTSSSGLQYDIGANQYVYNWATPSAAGCYTVFVKLDSGQVFPAHFNLTK